MTFEDTVVDVLKICPPDTQYLAAVSGGADSVAMLAALVASKQRGEVKNLHCITIDHGMRGDESRADAEFVRSLCEQWQIPCNITSIPRGKIAETARKRGIGLAAAARLYRRRAWLQEASRLENEPGPVRILVAHTTDDLLETSLMRVLLGAGPQGLAAMPVSRGRILRPLLTVSRCDVLAYLKEKNIPWREDPSNADTAYLRNRVRGRLIPVLNEHFPHWRTTLASFAHTQSLAARFIKIEAKRRITWIPGRQSGNPRLYTNAANFFSQLAIIREEALFAGMNMLLDPKSSSKIKRATIRLFSDGNVKAVDLGALRLLHEDDNVIICAVSKNEICEYGFSLLINKPGLYTLKGITIEAFDNPDGGFIIRGH